MSTGPREANRPGSSQNVHTPVLLQSETPVLDSLPDLKQAHRPNLENRITIKGETQVPSEKWKWSETDLFEESMLG